MMLIPGKHLFFYLIVGLNLVAWLGIFFFYLPLFRDGSYLFLLDLSSLGFFSNDARSKIEIDPFSLLLSLFFFSSLTFLLKFYLRERHILLISVTLLSMFFSFGGVVSSLFLSSKINFLKNSILDEVSLGRFNLLSLRFCRTPEETWTSICNYMNTNLKFSNLVEEDKVNLYNYIMSVKPSMLESINFLNSLHLKRIELLSKKESLVEAVQTKSYGLLDYLYPYFTADYYYLGFITTTVLSLGLSCLGFFLFSRSSEDGSLPKNVISFTDKDFNSLSMNFKSLSSDVHSLRALSKSLQEQLSDVEKAVATRASLKVFDAIREVNKGISAEMAALHQASVKRMKDVDVKLTAKINEVDSKFCVTAQAIIDSQEKVDSMFFRLNGKLIQIDNSYDQHLNTLDEVVKSQEGSIASVCANVTNVENDLKSLKASTELLSKDFKSIPDIVKSIVNSMN